jgi:Tetracyclin repressor-like, C-terminal domain
MTRGRLGDFHDREADQVFSKDNWMQTQVAESAALASSGRYPAFAAVLTELTGGFELDLEVIFQLGLSALLDGFASVIARPPLH